MIIKKVYTLVFIHSDNQILLGLKKRGFGVNKWNGFGGKVEPNESVIDAAVREMKEECCVVVKKENLNIIGNLEFTFEGDPLLMDVRVFSTNIFEGSPKETEEMKPKWFNYSEIPFKEMWLDDKIWFPYMLSNKLFSGKFHYKGHDTILNYNLKELESIDDLLCNK